MNDKFEAQSAQEILQWAANQYGKKAGLASSFGMEDMVLIDMLSKVEGDVTIFTLDTGRLHEETYETMELMYPFEDDELNLKKLEELISDHDLQGETTIDFWTVMGKSFVTRVVLPK